MPEGLENYASPPLRAAIFNRLYPGSQMLYGVVPIEEAFPEGWRDYEGKATQAIWCQIERSDGCIYLAYKEIDVLDRGKTQPQTPENLAKNQTKAMGRALTMAGIPQKMSELQSLMRWCVALDGTRADFAPARRTVDRASGEIHDPEPEGSSDPDGDDDSDAGAEETLEQVVQRRFNALQGRPKMAVATRAREMGIQNIMRSGDKAADILAVIDSLSQQEEETE